MLVTSVSLAIIAELPGPDNEYKFHNWSGEEIYPDEEEEYRAKAANTECYFLRRPNLSEPGSPDLDPSDRNLAEPIVTVTLPISESWKDHIGRDFFHQIGLKKKIWHLLSWYFFIENIFF